jgi:hypothetical protein
VRWYTSGQPRLSAKDADDAKIGPALQPKTVRDLMAGTLEGFKIEDLGGKFQLKKTKKDYRLERPSGSKPFDPAGCGQ